MQETELKEAIQQKIDSKTKPLGALGRLEEIAAQICKIQQTLMPGLSHPVILVFVADHGIVKEGVSAYPQEVTAQMVLNFLGEGAAINVLARQHGMNLKVIDAGVTNVFPKEANLVHAKVARGTKNMRKAPAMTEKEVDECFRHGKEIIQDIVAKGCNVVGFGEMGIGNTSSAALIMSALYNIPVEKCVGKGTGVEGAALQHKLEVLESVKKFHGAISQPKDILTRVGGLEIAQIVGGMLEAYEKNMLILVDGFIVTAAYALAKALQPGIQSNALFSHVSEEQGHHLLLEKLEAKPVLQLGMRLGEGTGCAMVYPIVQSAVAFLNEMASFEEASVSQKNK